MSQRDIDRYTAWRIGCDALPLGPAGTRVVPALPGRHPWLIDPLAATQRDVICLFQRSELSLLRTHTSPSGEVRALIRHLPKSQTIQPEQIVALCEGQVYRYQPDPFLYAGDADFRPVSSAAVRPLSSGDAEGLSELHAAVDPRHRWFVEIDHPIVFGLFTGGQLLAAASHFLFEDFGMAAAGVLTHPGYRRRGFGTAVVSAAVAWALERGFIVEWSTTESNIGSLRIARRLGFQPYAVETEFRVGEARAGAA